MLGTEERGGWHVLGVPPPPLPSPRVTPPNLPCPPPPPRLTGREHRPIPRRPREAGLFSPALCRGRKRLWLKPPSQPVSAREALRSFCPLSLRGFGRGAVGCSTRHPPHPRLPTSCSGSPGREERREGGGPAADVSPPPLFGPLWQQPPSPRSSCQARRRARRCGRAVKAGGLVVVVVAMVVMVGVPRSGSPCRRGERRPPSRLSRRRGGEPEPKLFASFLETAQWRARRRIRGQG